MFTEVFLTCIEIEIEIEIGIAIEIEIAIGIEIGIKTAIPLKIVPAFVPDRSIVALLAPR